MEVRETTPVIEEIELVPLRVAGTLTVVEREALYARPQPFYRRYALIIWTIVVPMAVVVVYLFLIASNRYESEADFIVRSVSGSGDATGGIAALLQNTGLTRSTDETYAVNEYITSRDMVRQLVKNDHLLTILDRPEADYINRYPNFYSWRNQEGVYRHFQNFVNVWIDGTTGISTLQVSAFRPEDAHALAAAILKHSEELINRLNVRAYDDAEQYAQLVVDEAHKNVAKAELNLTSFRNRVGSVDPSSESAAFFGIIGQMMTQLATLEAQLREQEQVTPDSPAIPALKDQVNAYSAQIDKQRLQIVGNDASMATKLGEFETLLIERLTAAHELENAEDGLTKARQDARQQHLYLETIVEPHEPDYARYPRRTLWFFIDLAICLAVFAIIRSLASNILDHRP